MNNKRCNILALLLLLISLSAEGQGVLISGRITTIDDSLGLPGANIVLEGTSQGTISDINGNYSLALNTESGTLIFSYIGYISQKINFTHSKTINVVLAPEMSQLDGIVVTALGIKRDEKSIGYSMQEVKGEDIQLARDASVINQLAGKVAGLSISATNSGSGSSSRIVLRGNNSFTNNNQALIVVDGVPMENSTISNSEDTWGGRDYGNGVSDINPDDIESVSVLKGASASALYGSRAANGVILINTKKGSKKKGIGVSFTNNTSVDRPYIHYELQDKYGGGRNGQFAPPFKIQDGIPVYDVTNPSAFGSWGPEMLGQDIVDWDGKPGTYWARPDNYKDYFQTGWTLNNALSLDGGNNTTTYRVSIGDLRTKEIIPEASFSRTNLGLNFSSLLFKKVEVNIYFAYARQSAKNRYGLSDSHDNVNRNYMFMPRHISNESMMNNIINDFGEEQTWYMGWAWQTNPYYGPKYRLNSDKKNRYFGHASATWNVNEKLNIMLRTAPDYSVFKNTSQQYRGSSMASQGSYTEGEIKQQAYNSDLLISYDSKITTDLSYSISGGGNLMYQRTDRYHGNTVGGLAADGDFSLENSIDPPYYNTSYFEKAINSVYAFARFDYRHTLFLDITGRNDWSSTLPANNNSYFYPSFNLSWAFSELIDSKSIQKVISFGKIRASYAEVGSDAEPYQLQSTYYIDSTSSIFGTYAHITNRIPAADLKPEKTRSIEFGTDLRFFMNRVSLDFTWYKTNTINQIVAVDISAASGSTQALINAGNIENKGIELQIRATPVKTSNFVWEFTVNYTRNRSKVIELAPGVDNIQLLEHWRLSVEARPGNSYGDIVGYAVLRDGNNNKLVNENGMYIRDSVPRILGNINPDYSISFYNNFKYKNLVLGFLVDARIGGEMFAGSNMYGYGYSGNFMETLEGREAWYASEAAREEAGMSPGEWAATGGYLAEGVYVEGSSINGENVSGQSNQSYINPEKYWDQFSSWTYEIHEPFVYDASFVKLREISITWNLPKKWLNKVNIANVSFSIYGKNVWLIYSKVPNLDPESFYTNGNGQGYELYSYPNKRSFGMSLNIKI